MHLIQLHNTAEVKTKFLEGYTIWIEDPTDSIPISSTTTSYDFLVMEDSLETVLKESQEAFNTDRKVFI